ncbi:MAG TPA: branched-chain amino acid ABC transporter permease [Acidimicrobiales bacterium]
MTTVWAGLSVGAIYVLVAIGYNIVFISAGTFNFANANLIMAGVFLAYWGLAQHGLPVLVVFIVAGLAVMVLAGAEERVAFRPVKHIEGHLVTSVGAAVLITGGVQLIWGVQALQVPFFRPNEAITFLGGRVTPDELWLIALAVAFAAVFSAALRWTMLGLACLATSEDGEAARLRGINTRWLAFGSFAVSGALAGVIGPFVGPKTYAFSTLAAVLALKGFVALAMGGFGSIPGCLAGGFVVGMVESLTARYVGGAYQDLMVFALLLLVLMLRPTGLLGERAERLV